MEALAAATKGRAEAMLEAIRELVGQNSHTGNKPGGDAVASLLAERAKALGLVVTRLESERFADHLVIATPAAQSSAEGAIVFVGHIYLFHPAFLTALDLLPDLGPVRYVLCEGMNSNPRRDSSVLWD